MGEVPKVFLRTKIELSWKKHVRLHDALCRWLDGAVLFHNFNSSTFVFLPKGEEERDHIGIRRVPGKTRPLTLSNTIAKLFAVALNRGLAAVAKQTVHPQQCGFIPGRWIADAVIEVDGTSCILSRLYAERSGLGLLDISAAFPSLSLDWMFRVLRQMQFPRFCGAVHPVSVYGRQCSPAALWY